MPFSVSKIFVYKNQNKGDQDRMIQNGKCTMKKEESNEAFECVHDNNKTHIRRKYSSVIRGKATKHRMKMIIIISSIREKCADLLFP